MSAPRILLTGASGAVGTDLACKLLEAEASIVALLHTERTLERSNGRPVALTGGFPPAPRAGEVRFVVGDLTEPRLGLPEPLYGKLATSIDLIVHSGAITDFGRPAQVYEEINTRGTRHVLELAQERAGAPIPLVYVSTAIVCGERDGLVMETDLDVGQRFANPYEESKCRAELMVHEARGAGVPAAIVRPSVVVGAQRNGQTRDFQNIYIALKVITEGRVSSIPGQYGALLDLVPVDYVVSVITEVARRFDEAEGKTFHAVNGTPLTLRDMSDVLAEYPPFHAPRVVPPQNFDPAALPALERRYYNSVVSLYDSYFRRQAAFDNTHAAAFVDRPPPDSAKPFFRRLLNYCLRVGYLGSAQPGPAAVLASLQARHSGPAAASMDDRTAASLARAVS
jgi:thioester reductase-like protein